MKWWMGKGEEILAFVYPSQGLAKAILLGGHFQNRDWFWGAMFG